MQAEVHLQAGQIRVDRRCLSVVIDCLFVVLLASLKQAEMCKRLRILRIGICDAVPDLSLPLYFVPLVRGPWPSGAVDAWIFLLSHQGGKPSAAPLTIAKADISPV